MCRHQKGPISDSGEWRSCFEVGLEALIVFNLIMPQGGGARHGGRQQDAVPREKVAIVTILVAAQHDHLHHQLQLSPSYQLLVTISMASKIP